MLEPARAELVERPFSGVAKGRVTQVMGQADGLGQVLVQAQGAGNGAGDLRHLQRMGQPGAVQVPFRGQEYLVFCFRRRNALQCSTRSRSR